MIVTISDVSRQRTPVGQRLGDLLFDAGLVTEAQLRRALVEQQRTGQRLGRLLVAAAVITEAQLIDALSRHFGLDSVDLPDRVPDFNAVRLFRDCIMQLAAENAEADDERANAKKAFVAPPVPAHDARVVTFVTELLTRAVAERVSDVHLEPGHEDLRIRFRVDGALHDAMVAPREMRTTVVSRIKSMAELDIAEWSRPQDGRFTVALGGEPVDLRLATLPTTNGEALVIHILDRSPGLRQIDELGFLPDTLARFRSCYQRPWGAVLATGPTGSGKSTTLYAALAELNDPQRNIVTVEESVRYELSGAKQLEVDRREGLNLANAIRAIMRADPDVMLVGGLVDRETTTLSLEAALSGHLVLSALQSNDGASTPGRLLDMGVEPFLVTSAVSGIVAQRLVRRLCDSCKAPYSPDSDELAAAGWQDSLVEAADVLNFHSATGCAGCGGSGYHGRFAVHEVMPITEELTHLIAARAPSDDVRRVAVEQGMRTLRHDGLLKVALGRSTFEELRRVAL